MDRTRMVRRWRRNMDVGDDAEYVDMLATLSEGSVRRNFNPYTDIDWDSPEFAVTDNDPRWILPATDPLGRHPWYQAQSAGTPDQDRDVAPGQCCQGWTALRVYPDPWAHGLLVLDAQRIAGISVLPARGGRRVQPHHDVPGDGKPHRCRRARDAATAELDSAVDPAGRRPAADPVLHSAFSPARSPSITPRRTCCAKARRCIRSWSG